MRLLLEEFDKARQTEAKAYHRKARLLGISSTLVGLISLLIVLAMGFSQAIERVAGSITTNPWGVVAMYFLMGSALSYIITLPLGVLAHRLETSFDLSKQNWRGWSVDVAKGAAISFPFGLATAEVLYWLFRNLGEIWWPVAWVMGIAASVVIGYVAPVLLMPIFHEYEPLPEGDARERFRALVERCGLRGIGIYRMRASAKTNRGMAALTGIGKTRRVIVSDTLLSDYTVEEAGSVFAHELGHHVKRDVAFGLMVSALFGLVTLLVAEVGLRYLGPPLGMANRSSVATLPLILLLVSLTGLALSPLSNYLSRRREAAADRFAIGLTSNPSAFISAMVKIHDRNLTDAYPNPVVERLFTTHPAGHRRVAMAREWAARTAR